MKRQLKFSLKGYYEPTPANIRKMGDSLLAMSQFMAGFTIIMDDKYPALLCIAIGTFGKFLSNFFSVSNETT